MVQYFENGDLALFDGKKFRRDKKTGYFLNSTIHKRLHVYVWEYYNGSVPEGCEVHHKDLNKNNNEIENLQLMTSKEHHKLHASLWTEERREWARENLIENAVPASKEWHKSEAGKEWHSKHAKEVFENLSEKEYVCTYCGKHYTTKNRYGKDQNTFCCNACKSAYRRKMGFDDVGKTCLECGCEYVENKYRKTTLCPTCRHKKNRSVQQ